MYNVKCFDVYLIYTLFLCIVDVILSVENRNGGVTVNFGDKLKELRRTRGLSQKDLAKKLGVTQRTISYYESNALPPANAKMLPKLAEALKVRIDELAADDGNTKIHKLIEKLKSDTDASLIKWEIFDDASCYKSNESYDGEIVYKDLFKLSDFPQYFNTNIEMEGSYFYTFQTGGYLVAKMVKEDSVEFALFILVNDKTFIFLANSNSIEELEDLYWSITNGASSVNSLIDDYLNKDFAEEKLKGAWYPNPEEIPS